MKNITASSKERQQETGKGIRRKWNRRKTLVLWLVIAVAFLAAVCIGGSFCSEAAMLYCRGCRKRQETLMKYKCSMREKRGKKQKPNCCCRWL